MNSSKDLEIWEKVFSEVPSEWTQAAPTDSMLDCLAYFKRYKVKTVLDLGCGIGIWSIFLSKSGLEVKGIDFSSNAIKFAREWAAREGLEVEFRAEALQEGELGGPYGGIVAAKVLDNMPSTDLNEIRDNIYRSLIPGGLLFALFNPNMDENTIRDLEMSDNPTKGITMISYQDNELRMLFPDFNLLEMKTYEHGFRGLILQKPLFSQ